MVQLSQTVLGCEQGKLIQIHSLEQIKNNTKYRQSNYQHMKKRTYMAIQQNTGLDNFGFCFPS